MRHWVIFFLFSLCVTPLFAGAITVSDDAGHTLQLIHPAQRILVLAPDLVENVFAIGAGDLVIGVVQKSDYPPAAIHIPQVGSYSGIDLERIVAMHPDLIIAWKYAFPRQLAALQRFGIPLYVAAPKKLQDIPQLMRHLGQLTGRNIPAEIAAQKFEKDVAELKFQPHLLHAPKVFFLIDSHALITVNKDSWINQVIEMCGGKNIFVDARVIAPQVNRESVLRENPDVIFALDENDNWKKSWADWQDISAVKHLQLVTLQADWISRAGPRLVLGAGEVCRALRKAFPGAKF